MAADWIYLGSGSPRRRELLAQVGVHFTVKSAEVDESVLPDEAPLAYVRRLAEAKARAVLVAVQAEGLPMAPVLGSDTTVVLGDRILGKPEGEADAVAMLLALSGQTHQVMTAVALATETATEVVHAITDVRFRTISEAEARAYWQTGEPRDKAGAYGIQGLGGVFVVHLAGSYSGVVGLPLYETAELLKRAQVSLWQKPEKVSE